MYIYKYQNKVIKKRENEVKEMKFFKYTSPLVKLFYLIIFIFAAPKMSKDYTNLLCGVGIFIFAFQIFHMWICGLFYERINKSRIFLFTLIYCVGIYLGLYYNHNAVYFSFIPLIVEAIYLNEAQFSIKPDAMLRYHETMPLCFIIIAMHGSMLSTLTNKIAYALFCITNCFSSLLLIYMAYKLGEKFSTTRYKKVEKGRYVAYILAFACVIPILFSMPLKIADESGKFLSVSIEYFIYTLILMIYPFAQCRLFKYFYIQGDLLSNELENEES